MMNEEKIEILVEEIMRQFHFGSFEDYNNEELREYYREMLRKEESNARR